MRFQQTAHLADFSPKTMIPQRGISFNSVGEVQHNPLRSLELVRFHIHAGCSYKYSSMNACHAVAH